MLEAPQDRVGLPGCLGPLLTHVQLAVNQDSQIPFNGIARQLQISQSAYIVRVGPSQVQNLVLAVAKLRVVADCPAP